MDSSFHGFYTLKGKVIKLNENIIQAPSLRIEMRRKLRVK